MGGGSAMVGATVHTKNWPEKYTSVIEQLVASFPETSRRIKDA